MERKYKKSALLLAFYTNVHNLRMRRKVSKSYFTIQKYFYLGLDSIALAPHANPTGSYGIQSAKGRAGFCLLGLLLTLPEILRRFTPRAAKVLLIRSLSTPFRRGELNGFIIYPYGNTKKT